MYTLAYRDLGIFQENVVNCFLRDIVKACRPVSVTVTGEFASRGGLSSRMMAAFSKPRTTERHEAVADDSAKIAELSAIIQAVRDRVRARYPEPDGFRRTETTPDARRSIRVPIADLMPLVHARDAAQAKIAAIGSVNPRAGGLVNRRSSAVKKTIARALQWFVRDQIAFNRETVSAIEAVIEALNEHNRVLVSLAAQANERSNTPAARQRRSGAT